MSFHRTDNEQLQTTMNNEKELSTTKHEDGIEVASSTAMAEETAETAFAGFEVGSLTLALIYVG